MAVLKKFEEAISIFCSFPAYMYDIDSKIDIELGG